MQRLFSMFPQGGPGAALLLLRISVAATFLFYTTVHLTGSFSHLIFAGVSLIALAILLGVLTPFLSWLVCVVVLANLLIPPHSDSLVAVSLVLNSTALALLGPGAYSLDSRLFGRRVMVVPPRTKSSSDNLIDREPS